MEKGIFTFQGPTRIIYGPGAASDVAGTIRGDGISRILLVTGPGHTSRSEGLSGLRESLLRAGIVVVGYYEAVNDPPTAVVDRGRELYESEGCEAVVAFGGGSPIDCAKGIAASSAEKRSIRDFMGTGLAFSAPTPPLYAIPTTAGSGSEVTNAAVFIKEESSGARRKMGVSGAGLFPRAAFVDPGLHVSMPPDLTAATGMDALTHAVEAYVSVFHTPISDMYSLEAVRLIGLHLRDAVGDGSCLEARFGMALASTLAGVALSQAALGMVHGIAHPVGALGGLAHGLANAILLPFVMRACLPETETRLSAIGDVLTGRRGSTGMDGVLSLAALASDTGIPRTLKDAGIREELLPAIHADALTYRRRPASPRNFTDAEIGEIVREAFGASIG